jgi:hypothetical protein
MITELVKVSDPEWKGGVYPSDCAYKRTDDGLVPRGKTAYGDGVLEFLAENSFKVLPTEEIVRRKPAKAAASTPVPVLKVPAAAAPVVASVPTTPAASSGQGKKKAKKASKVV